MKNIRGITRVPLTINKAKILVEKEELLPDKVDSQNISEIEKQLKKKGYNE